MAGIFTSLVAKNVIKSAKSAPPVAYPTPAALILSDSVAFLFFLDATATSGRFVPVISEALVFGKKTFCCTYVVPKK